MMIDLTGEVVGFEKRLSGIREKYGEDSVPYQICDETMRFLANRKAMERQAETD